jgi:hypothetical protein
MRKLSLTASILAALSIMMTMMVQSSRSAGSGDVTYDSDEFKIKPAVGQTVLKNYASASEIAFAVVSGTITAPADHESPKPITIAFTDTVFPGQPPRASSTFVRFKGTALTFSTQTTGQSIDFRVVTLYKR